MRVLGAAVHGRTVAIDAVDYVAVDLETTGLFPGASDRIIEIATVRMSADGTVLDEWVTLVDPRRDLGPTHVHRLAAQDVAGAPAFGELIGDLSQRLADAVLVAHNVPFDLGFLEAEFARCESTWPQVPALCTMTLPGRLGLRLPGRSLRASCAHFGIAWDESGAHSALTDARAAGRLLARLLDEASRQGARRLADVGCTAMPVPTAAWPSSPTCGRTHTRDTAARAARQRFGFLGTVARRAAEAGGGGDGELAPYLHLLDRVVEDHAVTDAEADLLAATAVRWGLSHEQVTHAHRDYLDALVQAAWVDGLVSDAERRELAAVGFWLGVDKLEVERLINQPRPRGARQVSSHAIPLTGLSVCFTGQLTCSRSGRPITRSAAERLAEKAGLTVAERVTKTLDVLVVADPHTQSAKARKAREYGTRIVAEHAFWRLLGVTVD